MIFQWKQKGSTIAPINLFLAGLLVLLAAGWTFVQKGCHWNYQREANALFQEIEGKEIRYKNINNKYLPFNLEKSSETLKALKIDPKEAQYFDYSVEEVDRQTFRIIAQLKPAIMKKWYVHSPKTKFKLIYEKKAGEKGKLINP